MKYLVLGLLIGLSAQAQYDQDRGPDQAPLEPPYVTEEEWERANPDAQPIQKKQNKKLPYEVVEETDDHYKVRHPLSHKGLKRIKADGTYIFEANKSKIESYMGFSFGIQSFNNLTNNATGKSFNDVYDKTFSLFLDWEKPLFDFSRNFKWSYGVNIIGAQGTGFTSGGVEALESYTLIMLPLHLGFTYSMQYWGDTQWVVPYFGGGGDLFLIAEIRDDGDQLKTYTYGGHAKAGLRFLLDGWVDNMHSLDDDYGINHMWVKLEFRAIIAAEVDTMDISSQSATLGFGFDM